MGQHLGLRAQLSQQWSEAYLSYALEGHILHPSGSLDNLGPLMVSGEFPQEPICGWSCFADTQSGHVCRYLRCVSLLDVSGMT